MPQYIVETDQVTLHNVSAASVTEVISHFASQTNVLRIRGDEFFNREALIAERFPYFVKMDDYDHNKAVQATFGTSAMLFMRPDFCLVIAHPNARWIYHKGARFRTQADAVLARMLK
jgi:hypothetical protein